MWPGIVRAALYESVRNGGQTCPESPFALTTPSIPSPNLSLLPWLVAALVFGACSEQASGPMLDQVRETDLLMGRAEVGEFRTGAWLDGEAWMLVGTTGEGQLQIDAQLESGEVLSLHAGERDPQDQTLLLSLPGEGPRPISLQFEAANGLLISSLRLAQSEQVLATDETLLGSMRGRDVLLLVSDSVHAAHSSLYGHTRPTTPALDRLAQQGVHFGAAYSQTSWTLPSVTSLFTSQEQERHGVRLLDNQLGDELTTLAELFAARGYRTEGFIQNGVVGRPSGLGRGFEQYRVYKWGVTGLGQLLETLQAVTEAEDTRPLFAYVHLTPPHQPYTPPAPFRGQFSDPSYSGNVEGSIVDCALVQKNKLGPDHEDVRQLAAYYDENLLYADDVAGRIMSWFEARPGQGPLIVATSDHGEAFMQHGKQGHNFHVFEEMVHIPLVFSARGSSLPMGRSIPAPVSLLDVTPTLVDLCGLDSPSQPMSGRSLLGLFAGQDRATPRRFFYSSRYVKDEKAEPDKTHFAVRVGVHKLVRGEGSLSLFDLKRDPGELSDISAANPILVTALEGELDRWRARALSEQVHANRIRIDGPRADQIKILGYGGDEDSESD